MIFRNLFYRQITKKTQKYMNELMNEWVDSKLVYLGGAYGAVVGTFAETGHPPDPIFRAWFIMKYTFIGSTCIISVPTIILYRNTCRYVSKKIKSQ
jgi:hypothetical protein